MQSFCGCLDDHFGNDGRIYRQIKVAFILQEVSTEDTLHEIFEQGCFIANPVKKSGHVKPDADGYWLVSSNVPGEISGGRLMEVQDLKRIVKLLKPLALRRTSLQGATMPLNYGWTEKKKLSGKTILCVGFDGFQRFTGDIRNESCANALREYDLCVASEVSKLEGQLLRGIEAGYALMFEDPMAALLCAQHIRNSAEHLSGIPPQRIALDHGEVYSVVRAYGRDYFGWPMLRCRQLLRNTKCGEVNMTEDFVNAAFPRRQTREKVVKTDSKTFTFDEIDLPIWTFAGEIPLEPVSASSR